MCNEHLLEIELEENAANCLIHAFEHLAKETAFDLAEAIVLSVRAVELYVKAKIAKEDPKAIWESEKKTIGFDAALSKLRQLKYGRLEPSEESYIKSLKKMRNDLEHHAWSENKDLAKKHVVSVLLFLERFAGYKLRSKLYAEMENSHTQKENQEMIEAYQAEIEECYRQRDKSIQELGASAEYTLLDCPVCSSPSAVLIPDRSRVNPNEASCFVCREVHESGECELCKGPLIEMFCEPETEHYHGVHENCWEQMKSKTA